MHGIYNIHPSPDYVVTRIIAIAYDKIFTAKVHDAQNSSLLMCDSGRLSRLLFILGQCATCSLVYAEKIAGVAKKVRERNDLAVKEAAYQKSLVSMEDNESKEDADSMEHEMGMAAAADADHEQYFYRVVEIDIVCNEEHMLGHFHKLIAYIVANEKRNYNNATVRENAILALCRYMTVSSRMCDMYLPLLFTVLEKESNEANKTTIMIALGDLAFRFPNSLEPWITYMYSRLSDKSVLVRYNTLMVLTHLILNDMVKIKGQVSHVVMCLNDECGRIRSLASLFFSELSKRSNNPVYNLLGDIISFLSRDEDSIATVESNPVMCQHRKLTQAEFQSTMSFLLSFVKKDK